MNMMKILLVEDTKDQQDIFKDTVEVFNDKNDLNVGYEVAQDISEAFNKIDGSYDGAIIDLWLGNDTDGGNEIVRQLVGSFTRMPIIFVTAFPGSVNEHPSVIKTRSRDEGTYESDLLLFQEIHNTGLTHIMGGRGIIEENLSKVFLESLLPQINKWASYGKTDPERTEKALLRYTLNHLFQILEEDGGSCFPEEFYLPPLVIGKITTGSIVKEKTGSQLFVVLSPACDLVLRGENGVPNADCILFAEIENMEDALDGSKNKGKVTELCNNKQTYRHWLPKTDFFDGGVLNFRKLASLSKDDFDEKFGKPTIQISPFFVKDIVSRFSSYYARQGQPDIDSETIKAFIAHYTN